MPRTIMKQLVSLENLVAAVIVLSLYLSVGFAWYWPLILFVVFDVSALGYMVNKEIGAVLYNVVHSLIAPALLLAAYLLIGNQGLFFISLVWLFHIFVDRTLGFGLKHFEGFGHTHLGRVGKS